MSGRVNRALRCLALLPGHRRSAARFCSTQFETDSEDNLYNGDETTKDKNFSRSATYNTFGLYKAVLVGQVGFGPFEKILGDGRALTLFSIGTSGLIRPPNYPEQIQWHKVAVYPERLREIARQISKGRRVYLEGNMEVRIFNDYVTGAVKQIREISVRHDGQLILLEDKNPPRKLTLPTMAYTPAAVTNSPLDPCQEEALEDNVILPR
ncbi:single-stranded DNA-binding protein, mitochondrial-like isoform X1 [Selaginella moellendorffii]|uniref:single-stranded DNA-binding protein, mitochondrial-like isoform X1 n=1 Tax=Selaginella moellendorffii TaxID=88036 RepID=UPI000D1CE5F8|nr:single-stranded DNA-binding protein, mitochondrial-like isoform X1 [Selaginella moellendorffii]|eukprot:XP_024534282.1 single-stranded DNA-binding protein, mitochondrial-like isoform X1 [Selaginella moellendorffii]